MRNYLFGEIFFSGAGSQVFPNHTPSAIVGRIDETRQFDNDDEADDHMVENNYDGYLCLDTYKGRVISRDGILIKASDPLAMKGYAV